MYSCVISSVLQGIESVLVQVEADVSDGLPGFDMVGFLASEVKESRDRIRTALRNSGFLLPAKKITVNFSPADIRKSGSGFDLPVAIAMLAAMQVVKADLLKRVLILGEVGLNGDVIGVNGVLPAALCARDAGMDCIMVPKKNEKEAMLAEGIRVLAVDSVQDAIFWLMNWQKAPCTQNEPVQENTVYDVDFADINGQFFLKRACVVAAAGMHNLLIIGPPGSGKTMAAQRIPTILPPLNREERLELSRIYSVCGLLGDQPELCRKRPFRNPHHTITPQALAGGGSNPKPGEISLAHRGVLFLDELPEYQKNTLEILREPMEEKQVRIVRLNGTYTYPSDFMLVAAMNPCLCGFFPDMNKCHCSQASIRRYLGKISQPLLDRIDISVEAPRMTYQELTGTMKNVSSRDMGIQVQKAQEMQRKRFEGQRIYFNSQIPVSKISVYCPLDQECEKRMEIRFQKLNLSARSYYKILKVARTIADLEGEEQIRWEHLNEAIQMRSLDKRYWGA